jgi:hypothetical protein
LQAVDREDDLWDRSVLSPQGLEVLLSRGKHDLIPLDVPGDGVFRELDVVFVLELGSNLRDRPVTCAPSMSDPAENIPPDCHLGQGDGDLKLRALGLQAAWTGGVRAVIEPAEQFNRSIKGMKAAISMVTDVHHAPTAGAITLDNVEFPRGEIRLLGPQVRHPANLHVVVKSTDESTELTTYKGKA